MSLEEAVELVIYAFSNGESGDLMVQKAPASSIGDLAQALIQLFGSDSKLNIIGTRHGEKLYETLLTKEEYFAAQDKGKFYRVPADKRDLNYDKYYHQGSKILSDYKEYNSNNTERLNIEQIKELLLTIDYVQKELKGGRHE